MVKKKTHSSPAANKVHYLPLHEYQCHQMLRKHLLCGFTFKTLKKLTLKKNWLIEAGKTRTLAVKPGKPGRKGSVKLTGDSRQIEPRGFLNVHEDAGPAETTIKKKWYRYERISRWDRLYFCRSLGSRLNFPNIRWKSSLEMTERERER